MLFKIYSTRIYYEGKIAEDSLNISENHFGLLLTEAIDNALKFSAPFENVKIITKSMIDFYRIEITNKGKEFNPSQIKRVSEFVQFDRDEFQQNGNGLGLTIIKSILNYVGGSLEIKSKNSQSKVIIDIPLKKDNKQKKEKFSISSLPLHPVFNNN